MQDQLQQELRQLEQLKQEELRQEQLKQEQLKQEQLRQGVTFVESTNISAPESLDATAVVKRHTQDANVHTLIPVGTAVQYLSSKQGWIPASIQGHADGRLYNLDVKTQADPARVRLPIGTRVQYLSASQGEWITAVVQAFDEHVYKLDIHANADPAKVRLYEAAKVERPPERFDEDPLCSRQALPRRNSQVSDCSSIVASDYVKAGTYGIEQTSNFGARRFLNADIAKGSSRGGSGRFDALSERSGSFAGNIPVTVPQEMTQRGRVETTPPRGRYITDTEIKPARTVERAVSPSPIHAERFPVPVVSTLPSTAVISSLPASTVLRSPAPVIREVSPAPCSPTLRVQRSSLTLYTRPENEGTSTPITPLEAKVVQASSRSVSPRAARVLPRLSPQPVPAKVLSSSAVSGGYNDTNQLLGGLA